MDSHVTTEGTLEVRLAARADEEYVRLGESMNWAAVHLPVHAPTLFMQRFFVACLTLTPSAAQKGESKETFLSIF